MKQQYKILSVVGARPQFIKLAGLHRAIINEEKLLHVIVHSGQHYDYGMSGQFFKELDIPQPDYNIGIGSGHHNIQLAKCITGINEILEKENPDMVIVYGDTNTTAAAAIAASKRNLPLAHVEAGLREFDKSIPEEINKLITDAITDIYFTPTKTGFENLKRSGINKNVFITGDISLDLLYENKSLVSLDYIKTRFNLNKDEYVFITCHRVANTNNRNNLEEILMAIAALDYDVIFAIHPRTKKAINDFQLSEIVKKKNIHSIDPIGFWETQSLIKHASFVLTDSGGIIKESYFYKTATVILDKQTEWIESVNEGWAIISGPNKESILHAVTNWLKPVRHTNCIGDGHAGKRIVQNLLKYLDAKK